LAQNAEQLGWRLRALRAEAESRAALGDLSGAIDRLRAAQRQSRNASGPADFIDASIIEARLRDLEGQRRQLAADLKSSRGGGPP
jgi:predicted Zn-dependent protease